MKYGGRAGLSKQLPLSIVRTGFLLDPQMTLPFAWPARGMLVCRQIRGEGERKEKEGQKEERERIVKEYGD